MSDEPADGDPSGARDEDEREHVFVRAAPEAGDDHHQHGAEEADGAADRCACRCEEPAPQRGYQYSRPSFATKR
jgi:hypothetical protein